MSMRLLRRYFDPWLQILISGILLGLIRISIGFVAHATKLAWVQHFNHGLLGLLIGGFVPFVVILFVSVNLWPNVVHPSVQWLILPANKRRAQAVDAAAYPPTSR
ncbi:hypothetical protein [Ferrimicrobium sp.]|uniref:hypothetical protein n=2 Tax=Ferrimicrobium sp. TaxID=2926050 RepID=UPI002626A2F2|nr:hypothetical protein [Ferrimicrobium sp.]